MPQRLLVVSILVVMPFVSAQEAWLPPAVEQGLTAQLAERLDQLDLGWPQERVSNAAQSTVATIRRQLESWTEPEVIRRAPSLARLTLPKLSDPRLNAMARYQMCTALYFVRHQRRAREANPDARVAAVAGLTASTMAVLFLRHGFVAGGGTHADIEGTLTGAAYEGPIARIQSNPDDFLAVQSECIQVIGDITG